MLLVRTQGNAVRITFFHFVIINGKFVEALLDVRREDRIIIVGHGVLIFINGRLPL